MNKWVIFAISVAILGNFVIFNNFIFFALVGSVNIDQSISGGHRINSQSIMRIRRIVTMFVVVYLMCWTPYWVLFWFLSMVHILDR